MSMLEYDNGDGNSLDAKSVSKIGPSEEALNVLERLVADRKNEVWLLSGLRVRGVLERIAERLPGLGIVYVLFFPSRFGLSWLMGFCLERRMGVLLRLSSRANRPIPLVTGSIWSRTLICRGRVLVLRS